MPIHQVELPEHLERFVAASVRSGRFESDAEVIVAAVAALEHTEEDQAFQSLKAEVDHGLASGLAPGTAEDVFTRVRSQVLSRSPGR